jgi:hypothetical protein
MVTTEGRKERKGKGSGERKGKEKKGKERKGKTYPYIVGIITGCVEIWCAVSSSEIVISEALEKQTY